MTPRLLERAPRWLRLVGYNVVAGLVTAALVIAVAEAVCRATWEPGLVVDRYRFDERLNHVFVPGLSTQVDAHPDVPRYSFRTNELGVRVDEPFAIEKPPGTLRILVCGDSFVEGFDFGRALPALLEDLLAPRAEELGWARLHVVNGGVGSYSPMLVHFALREKLLALDPDLVVLAVDPLDPRDDAHYARYLERTATGELVGVRSPSGMMLARLRTRMIEGLPAWSPDRWIAVLGRHLAVFDRIFHRRALAYVDRYGEALDVTPEDWRVTGDDYDAASPRTIQRVGHSFAWVGATAGLLAPRGVELVVATYPHRIQVEAPAARRLTESFRRAAEALDLPFHDATADVLAHPDPPSLYLRGDIHFTYEGQEVWAASLAAFLAPHLERPEGSTAPERPPAGAPRGP